MSDEEYGHRVARTTLIVRTFVVTCVATLGAILYFVVDTAEETHAIVDHVEQQQDGTTRTVETAAETLDLIKDCTQPGGECFQLGVQRTEEAVGNIGRVSVYAAACAADPTRLKQTLEQRAAAIERCVTRLLERTTQPQGEN